MEGKIQEPNVQGENITHVRSRPSSVKICRATRSATKNKERKILLMLTAIT